LALTQCGASYDVSTSQRAFHMRTYRFLARKWLGTPQVPAPQSDHKQRATIKKLRRVTRDDYTA